MASMALASDDRYDLPLEDHNKNKIKQYKLKGFPKWPKGVNKSSVTNCAISKGKQHTEDVY